MIWGEVNTDYEFKDGSRVTQVKDTEDCECYSVNGTILSEDHLLLSSYKLHGSTYLFWLNIVCVVVWGANTISEVISTTPHYLKPILFFLALVLLWISWFSCRDSEIQNIGAYKEIPVEEDVKVQKQDGEITQEFEVVKTETRLYKKHLLSCELYSSVKDIYTRSKDTHPLKIWYEGKYVVPQVEYAGIKPCFCVTTDTGRYELNNMIHHNSVCLRNVIFHSLTHADDIKLALVDLKQSEFESYKKLKDVVGVANNEREAVEILRMARECMYKRNKENAARGITDFVDYQPQEPLPTIKIFGREFDEDYEFDVQVEKKNDKGQVEYETQKMKAKDILEYLN